MRATLPILERLARTAPGRPCAGCEEPCRCSGSPRCSCGCSAGCDQARLRLPVRSRHLDDAMLPLALELARLPGVALVRACEGHGGAPEVAFTASSPVTAAALSAVVADREAGRARPSWQLVLRADPHLAAREFAVVAVTERPAGPLAADLARLSAGLAVQVCGRARAVVASAAPVAPSGCESARLTPREREVLATFLRGFGPATIAARAGRSEFTVRNQLKSVCAKLGVASQHALRERFAAAEATELMACTSPPARSPRAASRRRRS